MVIVLIKVVGKQPQRFSRAGGVSLGNCEMTLQHQEAGTRRPGAKIGPSILLSSVATSGKELRQGEGLLACNFVVLTGLPRQDYRLCTMLGHG